ncbi:hypothetical protein N8791_06330 [Gammaproteobacteria bacterium]|nr:hypothetical protein [Gammaproteobacteria bacterium]
MIKSRKYEEMHSVLHQDAIELLAQWEEQGLSKEAVWSALLFISIDLAYDNAPDFTQANTAVLLAVSNKLNSGCYMVNPGDSLEVH